MFLKRIRIDNVRAISDLELDFDGENGGERKWTLLLGKTARARALSCAASQERRGSRSLVPRDAVLARIVDHEGISLLCGMHPRALPPFGAAEVVRSARGRLLRRRGAIPIDRLRDPAFGSHLIRHWEEAVNAGDAQSAGPPQFRNQDGDPLLPTTDHFDVTPGAAPAIEARVAALDGAERDETIDDGTEYAFLRPHDPPHPDGEKAVIGHVRVEPTAVTCRARVVLRICRGPRMATMGNTRSRWRMVRTGRPARSCCRRYHEISMVSIEISW